MTQQDFSSPQHRIDNLTNMRFVRAYALLRHFIHDPELSQLPVHELKHLCSKLDAENADALGLPMTSLVGRLVDLGAATANYKDAPGLAE
jgi:hypothetical protein